jgi:hypothetical protein
MARLSRALTARGVQWLAVKYGLTFARRRARESWEWVSWRSGIAFRKTRNYIAMMWHKYAPISCKILSTFWAEAAVLILVFPPLEFFLELRRIRDNSGLSLGAAPIGMGAVWQWSGILCLAFLLASVKFSEWASRKGADDKEK